MKRLIKISIVIVSIIVVIVNKTIEISDSSLSEKQIIKGCFYANSLYFEEVALFLMNLQYNASCYYENSKLIIKEIDNEYNIRIVNIEDEQIVQSIKYLLKNLDYKEISKYGDEVYFNYYTTGPFPYETGIVYSEKDIINYNSTFSLEDKLKDCWYCFFFGYT